MDREVNCLAVNIYYEARNQPIEGQRWVLDVVRNRVASDTWPDTHCGVVKQRLQFSWYNAASLWMPEDPAEWYEYLKGRIHHPADVLAFEEAMLLATWHYHQQPLDRTKGATHYMTWDLWTKHTVSWGETLGIAFKKKRTADLPLNMYYVVLAPRFGIDMKKLVKGIEAVFGKDLEESLTDIGGFNPGAIMGMDTPPYSDAKSLVAYCQGGGPEELDLPFRTGNRLKNVGMVVSGETLEKIQRSNCIRLFQENDQTSSIYEYYRQWKSEKFLGKAIDLLQVLGNVDEVCHECESGIGSDSVDTDGDCRNCGTELVNPAMLNDTIKDLQKKAA